MVQWRNRFIICSYLKREAGKVDGRAECEAWREECGEQEVAAVLGAAEALVRAVPRALRAPDPLGLPDHVIPHHLEKNAFVNYNRSFDIENPTPSFLIPFTDVLGGSTKLFTFGLASGTIYS